MFSSSGISCRHGPHQLAQKLSITTCPLYWERLILEPPRASRVNWGAGPLGALAPEAGKARMAVATSDPMSAAIRCSMSLLHARRMRRMSLKEDGRAQTRFHVVGELRDAQQVRPEHPIL